MKLSLIYKICNFVKFYVNITYACKTNKSLREWLSPGAITIGTIIAVALFSPRNADHSRMMRGIYFRRTIIVSRYTTSPFQKSWLSVYENIDKIIDKKISHLRKTSSSTGGEKKIKENRENKDKSKDVRYIKM